MQHLTFVVLEVRLATRGRAIHFVVKVGEEIAGAAAREYRCGPLLPLAPAGAAA